MQDERGLAIVGARVQVRGRVFDSMALDATLATVNAESQATVEITQGGFAAASQPVGTSRWS